jgi:hypothetical protein
MLDMDNYQILFLVNAFLLQIILIIHFSLRRWRFEPAMRYGWIVYALSIPYAIASLFILRSGKTWALWLGGFIYLVWAIYGYIVDYNKKIEWRKSLRWSFLVPYIILYLASVMFYWWPLALVYKPLWYVFAILFIISTYLNISSHNNGPSVFSTSKINQAL